MASNPIFYDKWGKEISSNIYSSQTKKINNPAYTNTRYNTNTSLRNPQRFLNSQETRLYKSVARDLFRSSPMIHGAINTLSGWVGGDGWKPKVKIPDKKRRKQYTQFLEDVFRNPTIYGINMTINRAVISMRNELATAGDFFYFITNGTASSAPRLAIYPGTMIGNRNQATPEIKSGPFAGHTIDDGVITERDTDFVLGYRVLGNKPEDDTDYGLREGIVLVCEPETFTYRGYSQFASSLITALDVDDISQAYSQIIRKQQKFPIIGKVVGGDGRNFVDPLNGMMGRNMAPAASASSGSAFNPYVFNKNDVTFIDTPEELKSFDSKVPDVNGQDWIRYLSEQVVYDNKWMLALMSPEKLTTGNLSMIETQIQKWQMEEVENLKRVIRQYALRVLAWGQARGLIDEGEPMEWRSIDFTPPTPFTLKSMTAEYIQQMDNGVLTKRGYNEANGVDHDEFIEEQDAELREDMERAEAIAKDHPWMSPQEAYNRIVSEGSKIDISTQEIKTQ